MLSTIAEITQLMGFLCMCGCVYLMHFIMYLMDLSRSASLKDYPQA